MSQLHHRFVASAPELEELEQQAKRERLQPAQIEQDLRFMLDTVHRKGAQAGAVACYDREYLVGYVPYLYRRSSLPLRAGEVKVASVPYRTIQLFGRVIVGEDEQLARTAVAAFAAAPFSLDGIVSEETPTDSPFWAAATRDDDLGLVVGERGRATHHLVDLPQSFDAYFAKLSSGTRTSLRRRMRELETFCGSWQMRRFTAVEDVPRFLDAVEPVVTKTFHYHLLGQDLTRKNTRFVRNLETWAKRGWFRGYALYGADRPVAYALGYQYRSKYQYETIGYDPELRKAAPGNVLLLKIIEDLIENQAAALLDFGAGDAEYKQLFGNRSFEEGKLVLTRRTPYALGVAAIEQWFTGASRAAVKFLDELGVKGRVKAFVRRASVRA